MGYMGWSATPTCVPAFSLKKRCQEDIAVKHSEAPKKESSAKGKLHIAVRKVTRAGSKN